MKFWKNGVPRVKPLIGILLLLALLLAARQGQAQSEAVGLVVVRPGEGETIYAGPETMVYSTHVTGWVNVSAGSPDQVELHVEILKGDTLIASQTTNPSAEGRFTVGFAVNPDKTSTQLTDGLALDRYSGCQSACHYAAPVALEPGDHLLRVTAIGPGGGRAVAERHITVDRAGYATMPVQVLVDGNPAGAVPGIRVSASTRVYLWRGRAAAAITDVAGQAALRVERLGQAPTHYLVTVEPQLVNGVRYESVNPLVVTVPAGASTAAPVTLHVNSRLGTIRGRLAASGVALGGVSVAAIDLDDATTFQTECAEDGSFSFTGVPFDAYLLLAESRLFREQDLTTSPQTIDLQVNPEADVSLVANSLAAVSIAGDVRDRQGNHLPFGWVTVKESGIVQHFEPESGRFVLRGLPAETQTIVVDVPGYYSQAQSIHPPSSSPLTLELKRTHGTQTLGWGEGDVVLPSSSTAAITEQGIELERGWLWGSGGSSQPLVVAVGDATIRVREGRFAIERLPGATTLFYQFDGDAEVIEANTARPVLVHGGEMLIMGEIPYGPAPLNTDVIEALDPMVPPAPESVWEPSPAAIVRDRLALLGISIAQLVTFITYITVLFSVVALPLFVIFWRIRKRTVHGKS